MKPRVISAELRIPSAPEDRLPGIDLHQIAAEQRDDDGQHQCIGPAAGMEARAIGEDEIQGWRKSPPYQRQAEGEPEHAGIVGPDLDIGRQGEIRPQRETPHRPEADDEQRRQRHREQPCEDGARGREQDPYPPPVSITSPAAGEGRYGIALAAPVRRPSSAAPSITPSGNADTPPAPGRRRRSRLRARAARRDRSAPSRTVSADCRTGRFPCSSRR